MSACFGCFFHRGGWMENECDYFEAYNYSEPNVCLAFSVDGRVSEEAEAMIFEETCGVFGKPKDIQAEIDARMKYREMMDGK